MFDILLNMCLLFFCIKLNEKLDWWMLLPGNLSPVSSLYVKLS